MSTFNYVVAKIIPDLVKNEPINIGIIVHDSKNKVAYGQFIDNFRSLAQRHRDFNIIALKGVLDGFRGEHKLDSNDYLSKLSKDFQYQLVFSEPSGVVAGSTNQASKELYERFISIAPARKKRRILNRLQLRALARKIIDEQIEKKWVIKQHPVKGPKDPFQFDFAFRNGKVSDLLHAISFEGNAENALTLSKALALTVEYAFHKDKELAFAALLSPPRDEKNEKRFYEPAIGYLKDKRCSIKMEDEIPQYVVEVKKKLLKSEASN